MFPGKFHKALLLLARLFLSYKIKLTDPEEVRL